MAYPSYPPAYSAAGWLLPRIRREPRLAFGTGVAITGALWGWGRPNCGAGNVNVNVNRFNSINAHSVNANRLSNRAVSSNTWQHNADHRRGVGYTNPQVRQQNRPIRLAMRRRVRVAAYSVGYDGLGQAGQRTVAGGICQMPQGRTPAGCATCKENRQTHRDRTQQARATRQAIWPTSSRPTPAVTLEFPGQTGEHVTAQSGWGGQCAASCRTSSGRAVDEAPPAFNGVGHGAATPLSQRRVIPPCRGSSRRWRGSQRWRSLRPVVDSQRRTSLMRRLCRVLVRRHPARVAAACHAPRCRSCRSSPPRRMRR